MKFYEIILIGVALAMDAFALTIANCTTYKGKLNKWKEWSMPTAFALFQFLMPVIGFYIGAIFKDYVEKASGYITFAVFFILATKIVIDNLKKQKEQSYKPNFNFGILTLQAVATSIDALIIGVTMAVNLSSPFIPSLIIGVVTFIIVTVALIFGKKIGELLGKYAEWFGAVILYALSIKNLIQAII